jgi:hypothetical protein
MAKGLFIPIEIMRSRGCPDRLLGQLFTVCERPVCTGIARVTRRSLRYSYQPISFGLKAIPTLFAHVEGSLSAFYSYLVVHGLTLASQTMFKSSLAITFLSGVHLVSSAAVELHSRQTVAVRQWWQSHFRNPF